GDRFQPEVRGDVAGAPCGHGLEGTPAAPRNLRPTVRGPPAIPRQGRGDLRVLAAGQLRPAGTRRREGVRAVLTDSVRRGTERGPRLELSRHHRAQTLRRSIA